jgi:hypothetical protein
VVPVAESKTQSPAPEFGIAGTEGQPVLRQVPLMVHWPTSQEAERVPEVPAAHVGVHVEPLAAPSVQSPEVAVGRVGKAPHVVWVQEPETDQDPEEHVARRSPVKPVAQVGVHVEPEGASKGQESALTLRMEGRVGHEGPAVLAQTPVTDQTPREHEASGVPAKPGLHVGVHVVPEAESATQSPVVPSATVGRPEQGSAEQVPELVHAELVQVAERVPE